MKFLLDPDWTPWQHNLIRGVCLLNGTSRCIMYASFTAVELLEQAYLIFGIAQSDEQLEKIVGKFLCPIIAKMASEDQAVRDKVCVLYLSAHPS